MDPKLQQALELLESSITDDSASCVIASEHTDESTLLGTKDGYLNLISALLRQVVRETEWSDELKKNMYQLPSHDAWIVGCELHNTKDEMLARLKRFYEGDDAVLGAIDHDPQFKQ
ncbi:hypothetical protein [Cerasicoccus frondis]|uniref:hypothetical protein n=1 Tax=Cerasicoccus frondis TaxID=490090 RepID=UPI00285291AD|nr:hypothetical protein [Cerasicoccus frondis]